MKTPEEKADDICAAMTRQHLQNANGGCVFNTSLALRDAISNAFRGTTDAAYGVKFCDRYVERGEPLSSLSLAMINALEQLIRVGSQTIQEQIAEQERIQGY
mgnify:CR=1 FL=1